MEDTTQRTDPFAVVSCGVAAIVMSSMATIYVIQKHRVVRGQLIADVSPVLVRLLSVLALIALALGFWSVVRFGLNPKLRGRALLFATAVFLIGFILLLNVASWYMD